MNAYQNRGWTLATIAFCLLSPQAALSQFSSGSTGADGAFAPAANQNITVRPGGVYNYTTVNIPAGVTVRYFGNLDNSPVVILATGNVTIDGAIVVSGFDGAQSSANAPALGGTGGPGGFSGGIAARVTATENLPPAAGHGPGGGAASNGIIAGQSGNYAAPTSFAGLTPLFGGSGGGGGGASSGNSSSGSGGGGAILIASSTRITNNGAIRANGGNHATNFSCFSFGGAGAGGAIRLVAPEIAGGGQNSTLQALGGTHNPNCGQTAGGPGRLRLEASNLTAFTGLTNPTPSIVNAPGPVSPAGNPALASVPTLAIASVGGTAAPGTATASYSAPDIALAPGTPNPIAVVINATNTPVGSPTEIRVRLIPRGTASTVSVPATDHTGTFSSSSATANVTLAAGQVTVLQAFASMTLTGQFASLFPLIDGEPVERVTVAANLGESSSLSLVTKSGKERRLDELTIEEQIRVARAWEAMRETRTE